MNKNYDFLPHELKHMNYVKDNAHECSLFLKRDDSFPLEKPTEITLIGNGVRHTIIGGTGSGAVNVRYKESIEEAFINAGFKISSTDWLNSYDKEYEQNQIDHIKFVKKEAKLHHTMAAAYAIGKVPLERDYEFPIIGNHEIAIYVLSRNAGENSDRRLEKGDVYLSDTEIRDILLLNRTYKKFLLVLNTPAVIDLAPVMEAKNILLLSQLGSLTGDVLVDIILGKKNPSGKLTDTWANIKDYPYISTPINDDETRYLEGIYVGYRYFESKGIDVLFPFGFGLSYTDFEFKFIEFSNSNDEFNLKVNVTNVGKYSGKEVVQVYMSGPSIRACKDLLGYKKSKELKPKESEELEIKFILSEFARYDESLQAYVLDKGQYLIQVGNSIKNVVDAFAIEIKEDITVKKVKNVFAKPDFDDLKIDREEVKISNSFPKVVLSAKNFKTETVSYKNSYEITVPKFVKGLTIDELIHLCLGDYKGGIRGMIGDSCSAVPGGAAETTLRIESLSKSVTFVDGPAGLRLIPEYVVNDKGTFSLASDSIWEVLNKYLPAPLPYLLSYERNIKKKGSRVVQLATALPIATALAQSYNPTFIEGCGRLVKEEMELYGVDVWLAPGVNIHRHILCGRNFEYYSEDPLVAGLAASAMINGVQKGSSKATTIKHFACNNLETNRVNNNSMVSERAIREIYLPAFHRAIKYSNPKSIMTCYNLIDGIHGAEHRGLLIDILRTEWGYDGLVMTDWITSGQVYKKGNKYPAAYASHNLKNGNNICMPGNKKDIKDIKKALKSGYLTREDLENSGAVVFNFINSVKKS